MGELCQDHSAHSLSIELHDKRLDAHSIQLDKLRENLVCLTEIEHQNQLRIDKVDERLVALESVPADKWHKASDYVLTAVLGLVIGVVAANTGLC